MRIGDNGTSLTGLGMRTQGGGVAFTTTHWSVVMEAQGESPGAQEALEKLCRTYWRPIYSFVRRQRARTEDAEDLTQGFFALLLERKDLNTVRKEKGRLRSYLLTSVKNFLADESRHAMAAKRGKGQRLIPLDEIREHERIDVERSDGLTPDQVYERRWAFTVLEQVMTRPREESKATLVVSRERHCFACGNARRRCRSHPQADGHVPQVYGCFRFERLWND